MASNNNNIHEINLKKQDISIIIVPFPAQGHLNQLLQLSCLISSYNFPVHYIGSSIYNSQVKIRANGLDPFELSRIHFHDIPSPEFPSPLPNPNAPTKFPAHLQPSWDATLALREPVAEILQEIASHSRKIIVIHDRLISFVIQDAQHIPNAECYMFNCIPAFTVFFSRWEEKGKPPLMIDEAVLKNIPSWEGCFTEEMFKFVVQQTEHCKFQAGEIFNSSRLIDGIYVDLMAREEISENKKLWAIGPILPLKLSNQESVGKHKCLEWLDKQPEKSVIYVSFGTMTSVSEEEVRELAIGLEQSKQRFIWVLRDADKGNIFGEVRKIELSEGFEDRVLDYGIVVRDWAPQVEILAHKSTGGFMSHCGWNSCIESLTMGVPIAAWPMHSDQARNTVLITQILQVGLVVREWERRGELIQAGDIAEKVQRLMKSQEGDEMRKKVEELGRDVRKSREEGGAARLELDSFIAHIAQQTNVEKYVL